MQIHAFWIGARFPCTEEECTVFCRSKRCLEWFFIEKQPVHDRDASESLFFFGECDIDSNGALHFGDPITERWIVCSIGIGIGSSSSSGGSLCSLSSSELGGRMTCDDFENGTILSEPFMGFENFLFGEFIGKTNDVNEISLNHSDIGQMFTFLFGEIV